MCGEARVSQSASEWLVERYTGCGFCLMFGTWSWDRRRGFRSISEIVSAASPADGLVGVYPDGGSAVCPLRVVVWSVCSRPFFRSNAPEGWVDCHVRSSADFLRVSFRSDIPPADGFFGLGSLSQRLSPLGGKGQVLVRRWLCPLRWLEARIQPMVPG